MHHAAAHVVPCMKICVPSCVRITLNINDKQIAQAEELTGVREKTQLARMGLDALIAAEAADRRAALGGSEPKATEAPRRRKNAGGKSSGNNCSKRAVTLYEPCSCGLTGKRSTNSCDFGFWRGSPPSGRGGIGRVDSSVWRAGGG